jgi:hypothetical protein
MMNTLRVTEETWEEVQVYLDHISERMAFLAATRTDGTAPDAGDWTVTAVMYLDDDTDYAYQAWHGVELADHIRPKTLMWSTELDSALVEVHSHGAGTRATTFSTTDLRGLIEIIPSVLWRLAGRPYAALVVGGRKDHDSLTWQSKGATPQPIADLVIGTDMTHPTGLAFDRLAELKKDS